MWVKALIDEQLSSQIVEVLRRAGHDALAVTERDDLIGRSDRVVLEVATRGSRAVVTNNVKDFRRLTAERLAQGGSHAGLVLLPAGRIRTRAAVGLLAAAIRQVLSDHPDGLRDRERWIGPLADP